MRTTVLFGLFLLLAACAGPGLVTGEPAQPMPSPQPTPVPSESPAQLAVEGAMPLYLWNRAQRRYEIRLVDLDTGRDVPGHAPFVVGGSAQLIGPTLLSADGQKIAIAEANGQFCYASGGGVACMARADVLHLIDRPDWHEVTAALPGKGWAGPLTFSPDSARLALVYNERESSTVMLFDTNTGSLVAQQEISFHPSLIGYTHDGTALAVYGQPFGSNPGISQPDPPGVALMDAATLEVEWQQQLADVVSGYWCLEKCDAPHGEQTFADWTPAVALSPGGHKLYIVHADSERLTTIDFDARAVSTAEIKAEQSWLEQFLAFTAGAAGAKGNASGAFKAAALSPDGARLYVIGRTMNAVLDESGQRQTVVEPLGLQVIDVESGRKLSSADSEATWIKITPDGNHLLLGSWGEGWTDVLDAASLESVTRLARWEAVTARDAGGRSVILAMRPGGSPTTLAVLDPGSFAIVHSWSPDTSYAAWVTLP